MSWILIFGSNVKNCLLNIFRCLALQGCWVTLDTAGAVFNILSLFSPPSIRYITQQGHKLEVGAPRPPATVTNAVSWRSEGIKYRKNEVFMDVIESVNLLVRSLLTLIKKNLYLKNFSQKYLYKFLYPFKVQKVENQIEVIKR